jgi:uncharacterized protein involved in exopolysaccharide biosynthesis
MKEHEQRSTALALPRRTALANEALGPYASAEPLDQTLHLRDLLRIFLKRKWTILAIFAISAVFSVVLTYLASPVYRASTTIQIERFTPQVLNYKDVTPVETYDYDSGDFYYTNYELLKSRAVAERAAEDMGLRKGASVAASDTPAPAEKPGFLRELLNLARGGQAPVAVDASVQQDNAVVGAIQGSLTVEPVRRSRLVRLHFDSTDPFFAAKAVNTVAQSFININLERRFEASAYAKTFLEEKLLQTKAKLEDSERELVQLLARVGDRQHRREAEHLQPEPAGVQHRGRQGRAGAHPARGDPQAGAGQPGIAGARQENKSIQALKQSKAKLEAEYQDNLKVYKPAFPKMLQLQGQIARSTSRSGTRSPRSARSSALGYRARESQERALKGKRHRRQAAAAALQGRTSATASSSARSTPTARSTTACCSA